MKQQTIEQIERNKIIVVLRGISKEQALKTTEALYKGGIRLVEVAFDQNAPESATADIIQALCENFADKMCIGAGTVMTVAQVEDAVKAGAKYVIAPNTNKSVVERAKELGVVTIPGALTPTEISYAVELGADFVKVFPAGTFGAKYFKDVTTPLSNVKLLAVAGVTLDNINSFAENGAVGFGISSGIVDKNAVKSGDYEKITQNAKAYISRLNG